MTDTVSIDSSAEEVEKTLKALPTLPGGLTVTREVGMCIVHSLKYTTMV